jgi:hypothetical protein
MQPQNRDTTKPITLNQADLDFLEHHGLPRSTLVDASGMTAAARKEYMRAVGASFAYGTSPCKAAGHQIRTRAGHCVQCNPAVIAYQLRHDRDAFIYVATTRALGLVKVGQAADLNDREGTLQRIRYGGVDDWKIERHSQWAEPAGPTELAVHRALKDYRVESGYHQGAKAMWCRELFRCTLEDAVAALESALAQR